MPNTPLENPDRGKNIKPRRHKIERPAPDYKRFKRETTEYFERRRARLEIVATTTTPRGQTLDWIPVESQHPNGRIASPPDSGAPLERGRLARGKHKEALPRPELEDAERGPDGTVPILRKNLDALRFTKPLRKYLSKTRGHQVVSARGLPVALPAEDGNHRYASSGQSTVCFGGEGMLSCFDPWVGSSDDFSLIQIGLSNSDLGFMQTVEAGWQEYQDITGDWVPHLFLFYTTNGYSDEGDEKGGYNTDVDGWVQHDDVIFPGTTFTPYSAIGGDQHVISIKYELYRDNWWFNCLGRWVGYYPARLFMGNQSVFSTLGDHADFIGFWGEIFDSSTVGRTCTDMGSGNWAEDGWTRAAYMHNLRYQSDRAGSMSDYDGSGGIYVSDPDMYDIDTHFDTRSTWNSHLYLGGPGAC